MLATSVGDTIPEAKAPVKDALTSVGSAVGTLFGRPEAPVYALGTNAVSKRTEAALSLATDMGEIGFDSLDIAATRNPAGGLEIASLDLRSPEVRLSGGGRVDAPKGTGLLDAPFHASLSVSVKGGMADEMIRAGLVLGPVASDGFAPLSGEAGLAGTLRHVDAGPWHDRLGRAANAKPGTRE
jgi:hypothetical protein